MKRLSYKRYSYKGYTYFIFSNTRNTHRFNTGGFVKIPSNHYLYVSEKQTGRLFSWDKVYYKFLHNLHLSVDGTVYGIFLTNVNKTWNETFGLKFDRQTMPEYHGSAKETIILAHEIINEIVKFDTHYRKYNNLTEVVNKVKNFNKKFKEML